jgi:hypothetical protein
MIKAIAHLTCKLRGHTVHIGSYEVEDTSIESITAQSRELTDAIARELHSNGTLLLGDYDEMELDIQTKPERGN